jgi:hypothetical protein
VSVCGCKHTGRNARGVYFYACCSDTVRDCCCERPLTEPDQGSGHSAHPRETASAPGSVSGLHEALTLAAERVCLNGHAVPSTQAPCPCYSCRARAVLAESYWCKRP